MPLVFFPGEVGHHSGRPLGHVAGAGSPELDVGRPRQIRKSFRKHFCRNGAASDARSQRTRKRVRISRRSRTFHLGLNNQLSGISGCPDFKFSGLCGRTVVSGFFRCWTSSRLFSDFSGLNRTFPDRNRFSGNSRKAKKYLEC